MSQRPNDNSNRRSNRQQSTRQGQSNRQTSRRQQQQPRQSGQTRTARQGAQQRRGGGGYRNSNVGSSIDDEFAQYGKIAIAGHLILGLGIALTIFLFASLAPDELGQEIGAGDVFAGSVLIAWVLFIFLSAFPTLGIGMFIGKTASGSANPAVISAAVNAVAVLVTVFVMILLILIAGPGGNGDGGDLGELIGPLVGAVIAVGIIGAAAGALGDRIDPWLSEI